MDTKVDPESPVTEPCSDTEERVQNVTPPCSVVDKVQKEGSGGVKDVSEACAHEKAPSATEPSGVEDNSASATDYCSALQKRLQTNAQLISGMKEKAKEHNMELGSSMEAQIKDVLETGMEPIKEMTKTMELQQRTHRNHSFQLVQMQNELASIRQARENEVKEIETLRGHVVSLFKDLADARGLIGRLRIDCHSRGHTKTLSATRHVDIASMTSTSTDLPVRSTEQDTPSAINADIMARLSDVQDVQVLADALLQEQRPKLVEGLTSLKSVLDKLSISHKKRLKPRQVLIKTEDDDKENVPPQD